MRSFLNWFASFGVNQTGLPKLKVSLGVYDDVIFTVHPPVTRSTVLAATRRSSDLCVSQLVPLKENLFSLNRYNAHNTPSLKVSLNKEIKEQKIMKNPSKKERMTSIDMLEIIANPTKKESALFSRRFATISTLSMTSCSVFTGGDTTL